MWSCISQIHREELGIGWNRLIWRTKIWTLMWIFMKKSESSESSRKFIAHQSSIIINNNRLRMDSMWQFHPQNQLTLYAPGQSAGRPWAQIKAGWVVGKTWGKLGKTQWYTVQTVQCWMFMIDYFDDMDFLDRYEWFDLIDLSCHSTMWLACWFSQQATTCRYPVSRRKMHWFSSEGTLFELCTATSWSGEWPDAIGWTSRF